MACKHTGNLASEVVLVIVVEFRDIFKVSRVLCNKSAFMEDGFLVLKAALSTESRNLSKQVALGYAAQRVDDPVLCKSRCAA